eukprot:359928-Chlamydomonas_euryale.AAC.5
MVADTFTCLAIAGTTLSHLVVTRCVCSLLSVVLTQKDYLSTAAAKEALWLRKLMCTFEIQPAAVEIRIDNQSAMALLNDPILHARSKHIDIHYHFVRDRVARGELAFVYIPTADMVTDTFTKALPQPHGPSCLMQGGVL